MKKEKKINRELKKDGIDESNIIIDKRIRKRKIITDV